MPTEEIYRAMRMELLVNNILLHVFTLVVAISILVGTLFVERRQTILSIFLPMLSLSWAASVVRFDFFIHRQGAYLRLLESTFGGSPTTPSWEQWKTSLVSTQLVVPLGDALSAIVILIPTAYLLFGPAQSYFQSRKWPGARIYAWMSMMVTVGLLATLALVPRMIR